MAVKRGVPGWLIEERLRRIRMISFGSHKWALDFVQSAFYEEGVFKKFYFCDFFCRAPISIGTDPKAALQTELFSPFIDREFFNRDITIKHSNPADYDKLIRKIEGELKKGKAKSILHALPLGPTESYTLEEVERYFKVAGKIGVARYGRQLFERWRDHSVREPCYGSFSKDDFEKDFEQKLLSKDLNDTHKLASLNFYAQIYLPWVSTASHKSVMHYICIPIASKAFFYGYILAVFFNLSGKELEAITYLDSKKQTWLRETIRTKLLRKIVDDGYLPTLLMFENSWDEFVFAWLLEKNIKWKHVDDAARKELIFPYTAQELLSKTLKATVRLDEMELPFVELWKRRLQYFRNPPKKGFGKPEINRLLPLKSYFVSSPPMVKQIKKVMTMNLRKTGKSLPTVLIVGQAGSGKDTFVDLVSMFSEEYWNVEKHTLNMAAIRPNAVVGPLLMGVELKTGKFEYELKGVFGKAIEKGKRKHVKRVFILDELNSLDIDSQGILLRMVENGEVVPLGQLPDPDKREGQIDWLIIGVINENPKQLTREDVLKAFRDKSLFGELAGDFLYEMFRRGRRLRDDLYYRFVRGGEINLPDLNERRHDLPILFYSLLIEDRAIERDGITSGHGIHIYFEALEALCDPTLDWEGNIRKLQLLTKTIARSAADPKLMNIRKHDMTRAINDARIPRTLK